jgi:hypothetical protein
LRARLGSGAAIEPFSAMPSLSMANSLLPFVDSLK